MRKPTPAQRRILERLAGGCVLVNYPKRATWELEPRDGGESLPDQITERTLSTLERNGWLSRSGVITAAGRAALETQP